MMVVKESAGFRVGIIRIAYEDEDVMMYFIKSVLPSIVDYFTWGQTGIMIS